VQNPFKLVCPVSPKEANWSPVGLKFQTLLKLFIRQACSSINHQPKQFTFKAPPIVECTAYGHPRKCLDLSGKIAYYALKTPQQMSGYFYLQHFSLSSTLTRISDTVKAAFIGGQKAMAFSNLFLLVVSISLPLACSSEATWSMCGVTFKVQSAFVLLYTCWHYS